MVRLEKNISPGNINAYTCRRNAKFTDTPRQMPFLNVFYVIQVILQSTNYS